MLLVYVCVCFSATSERERSTSLCRRGCCCFFLFDHDCVMWCGCDEESYNLLFNCHYEGAVSGYKCRILATIPHTQPLPGSRYCCLFLMGVVVWGSPRWKGRNKWHALCGTLAIGSSGAKASGGFLCVKNQSILTFVKFKPKPWKTLRHHWET